MVGPEVLLIATLASTAFSVVGSVIQGNAANAAEKQNAQNKETQARIAQQQGTERSNRIRQRARQVMAEQRAQLGESGLIAGTGSNLDLVRDTAANFELDALTEKYNSNMDALGLRSEASAARTRGSAAQSAGYFNAATALLGGASSYSSYSNRSTKPGGTYSGKVA